jgi:hypothetical protein
LPKFEVTLDHFDKIRIDETKLNVTVCARYTYGKSVQGDFELNAYTKKFSYKTYTEETFKTVKLIKQNVIISFTSIRLTVTLNNFIKHLG